MKMKWISFLWLLTGFLALYLLAGCGITPDSPLPVSPLKITPYATRVVIFDSTPTLPPTATPAPSPTPNVYSIAKGDTLSKIAQRFGVSLDALLAANPGVQPSQLSVGQSITIPSASQTSVSSLLSTPVPADLGQVLCFPSVDGLTCLAPVHNSNADALENVRVQITIYGADGQQLGSQEAALPLDILLPGKTLPASTYFRGISSANYALSQLLSATFLTSGDQRYVDATIEDLLITIDWNRSAAQVTGRVGIPEGGQAAKSIWLVAIAYDASGRPVGFRRWEWKESILAGQFQPFTLTVYSEGPAIDHVEIQLEARP